MSLFLCNVQLSYEIALVYNENNTKFINENAEYFIDKADGAWKV